MDKRKKITIEPSLFAADFGKLADEARRAEQAGADALHIDIMDGHFVPNLCLSPKALAAINRATNLPLDVHIMVYNPYSYIEELVACGADTISFHFEATEDIEETLQFIRHCGVKAGLAFCPETSLSLIPKYLTQCDRVLLMTVNPGFGGQAFMPEVLDKVAFLRKLCNDQNIRQGGIAAAAGSKEMALPPFDIEVDGGVDDRTAPLCIESGANVLVSGSYLFRGDDMSARINILRGSAAT